MTLEDFFTLTEMKDGLTAPSRVEELVSVMKKEKDSSVKNFADATRQWAAVAGAIAATESKECLDLFIQLDGLWFIDRWLKDVQSFTPESSDCSVEETISALLQAIARLEIKNERLVSSGICITVKDLLSYKSSKVQDRAQALFDSWGAKDADVTSMDVDKAVTESDRKLDSGQPVSCAGDVLPKLVSVLKVESGEKTNDQDGPQETSNHADSKDGCPNSVPSPVKLESVQASVSARVGGCSSDGNADKQHLSDTKEGTDEALSKGLRPEHLVEDATHDNKNESVPDRSGTVHGPPASDSIDSVSKTNAMGAEEAGVMTDLAVNDAKETLSIKCSSDNDIDQPVAESRNSVDESGGLEQKGLDHADGSSALEETKDQGANISRLDDVDGCKEAKKHSKGKSKRKNKNKSKSKSKYFGGTCEFARLTKHTKDADAMRQTADMDLENGIVDALEVARLVANEVEREVVGYYEQSGSSSNSSSSSSSSESTSRGSTGEPSSPESINGGQENQNVPTNELPSVESISPETSEKGALTSSGNQDQKPENHAQDLESSQVTDAVREPENNADSKSVCEFDLNQEFSSEDPDHHHQVVEALSNGGASFVSASRAIAAPGMMPGAPLQFEGVLGWKGSAATSAFRPAASPRQASDSDRALSGGGTSSGSRHRQDFLDIDLNVAEEDGGDDNKVVNPVLVKQKLTLLPGLPSGESSVELSPKRTTERLKFDLNQMGDGDVPSSEWRIGGQVLGAQNGRRSPSPASSSCIQPSSMRNFDLNDNPSHTHCNDLLQHQQPFLGESSSSSQKIANPYVRPSDDSVISILGTKVANKNTFPPQTPLPFMNGRASEPVMDNTSFLRGGPLVGLGPAVPYGQSIYSYNGLAVGPAVPFPSGVMYGPAGPYVLDPRGPAVMTQLVGTASAIPSSYGQQPSLVMNLMGPGPGPGPAPPVSNTAGPFSNAMGPFRPSLDLNPAGYAVEGGSRDASFYRPVFFQTSQSRPPMEEQLRDNFFRPLSTSGGKRKEPETGWELFPTNYKHHQPPPPPPYL